MVVGYHAITARCLIQIGLFCCRIVAGGVLSESSPASIVAQAHSRCGLQDHALPGPGEDRECVVTSG